MTASPQPRVINSGAISVLCSQACAPRYIWFSVSQPKYDPDDNRWNKESTAGNRREPVGTCWVVANNFNDSQEYSPCRTSEYPRTFCQMLQSVARFRANSDSSFVISRWN